MRKWSWFIWIFLILNESNGYRNVIYKNYEIEIISNSTISNFDWKSAFYIFWTGLSIEFIHCEFECKINIDVASTIAKLNFTQNEYDIYQRNEISFAYSTQFRLNIFKFNVTFKETFNQIVFDCLHTYFIYTGNKYEKPYCILNWCKNIECQKYRNKNYKTYFWFYNTESQVSNGIYVNNHKRNFRAFVQLVVYNKNDKLTYIQRGFGVVILTRIGKTDYRCNYLNTKIAQLANTAEPMSVHCMMADELKYDNLIVLTIDNISYLKMKVYFKIPSKFEVKRLIKPFFKNIIHKISILTKFGIKSYILRNDSFIYYTKNTRSICELNRYIFVKLFFLPLLACVNCSFNGTDNKYFHLLIIHVSPNQLKTSYYTKNLQFCVKNNWKIGMKTKIIGYITLNNQFHNNEVVNKFITPVKFVVFGENKTIGSSISKGYGKYKDIIGPSILPNRLTVYLPFKVTFVCESHVKYIIVKLNGKEIAKLNKCMDSLLINNSNSIMLKFTATFYFTDYEEAIDQIYKLRVEPTIINVETVKPQIKESVSCSVETKFHPNSSLWSCGNITEEYRDWMPETVIRVRNNYIQFLDTIPLTNITCFCSIDYVLENNERVYKVNASIEFDLKSNSELLSCEIPMLYYNKLDWGVNFCNVAIFVLLLGTFLLTAFLITDGVFKNTMKDEIMDKLGFSKGWDSEGLTFNTKIIVSKRDGVAVFEKIIKLTMETERRIDRMKYLAKRPETTRDLFNDDPNRARRSIRFHDDVRRDMPRKSIMIRTAEQKRQHILRELKRRELAKTQIKKTKAHFDSSRNDKPNAMVENQVRNLLAGKIRHKSLDDISSNEMNLRKHGKVASDESIDRLLGDLTKKKFTVALEDPVNKKDALKNNPRHSKLLTQDKKNYEKIKKSRTMNRMMGVVDPFKPIQKNKYEKPKEVKKYEPKYGLKKPGPKKDIQYRDSLELTRAMEEKAIVTGFTIVKNLSSSSLSNDHMETGVSSSFVDETHDSNQTKDFSKSNN